MSSSQPDNNHQYHQQPNGEPRRSSSSGNDSSRRENPSPPTGYPPSPMVYPPPGQYTHPPHPPPPQPGSYPPNYHNYPYAQAPPVAGTPYYTTPQMYATQQEDRISVLLRGIMAFLIFFLMLSCITSIFIWLILRPTAPIFQVNRFSVSNFNLTSSPTFTANWDVNVTVENPNTKLQLYFDQIEVLIYYGEEDLLATAFSSPFYLETGKKTTMEAKLEANNADGKQVGVGSWVVEEMAEDRSRKGNVTFDLRMAVWSTFRSGSWWKRHVLIRVYCDNLVVPFVRNSGSANFGNSKIHHCSVFS